MARTTLKPAIRNGLTALIVILLGVNAAVVVVRYGRTDRTRVSVAPAPSTTTSPTTSPTTETTTSTPTTSTPATSAPTTGAPTTSFVPTTPTTAVTPAAVGSAETGATVATTVPDTTTVPATGPTGGQVAPAPLAEHPHTGGHPLSLLALLLVGVGLVGLRFTRRTRSTPSR